MFKILLPLISGFWSWIDLSIAYKFTQAGSYYAFKNWSFYQVMHEVCGFSKKDYPGDTSVAQLK